jgi:Ca2+-binding EF-hand superfamily protein
MIAFNCYDSDGSQSISKNELRLFLKHVPLYQQDANNSNKYGISFGFQNEANISKNHLFENKKRDDKEIEELINILCEYFDE